MPRAWVFNLDADDELARYPFPYERPTAIDAIIKKRLPRALLPPGDVVVGEAIVAIDSYECAAWCPTPLAVHAWRHAGLRPAVVPSPEVLRSVNHRQFALRFSDSGVESRFIESAAQWDEWLLPHCDDTWLLKRPFGYVGRGQRKITLPMTPDDRAWAAASLQTGGFVVERFVRIVKELALHGIIKEGRCTWGTLTEQEVDEHRVWRSSRLHRDVTIEKPVRDACEPVVQALVDTGYFGPFGVDGYLWENDRSVLQLNAVSELNARYTMGYAVGMGNATQRQ